MPHLVLGQWKEKKKGTSVSLIYQVGPGIYRRTSFCHAQIGQFAWRTRVGERRGNKKKFPEATF